MAMHFLARFMKNFISPFIVCLLISLIQLSMYNILDEIRFEIVYITKLYLRLSDINIFIIEQGTKILFSSRIHVVLTHKSAMLWKNDLHFKGHTTNISSFTLRRRFISLQFGHFVSIFYVESLYATTRNIKLIFSCQKILAQ